MATQLSRMHQARGTAAEWTSNNPTLDSGELGYETDTGKVKMGDGVTAWVGLAYLSPDKADVSATVTHVEHGSNPSVARPSGYALVIWQGSVQPNNAVPSDMVIRTDEAVA